MANNKSFPNLFPISNY